MTGLPIYGLQIRAKTEETDLNKGTTPAATKEFIMSQRSINLVLGWHRSGVMGKEKLSDIVLPPRKPTNFTKLKPFVSLANSPLIEYP
jgi:hypothetical protein